MSDLSELDVHRDVDVDVVVTHYEDERRLAWVLDSLAAQTHPAERLHVVVADDGSTHLPRCADERGVTVVVQADEGFRAAAARNLGAAQGNAPFVLFLDGDSVPEPGYVAAMVAALAAAETENGTREGRCGPGALVTGRRRHACFDGFDDDEVHEWSMNPPARKADREFDDPQWLLDGHARTDDLRAADVDDWRYVISAVLGVSRPLFEAIEGFDVSLVGYGGEDWDLAYRAWNAGATFRHTPAAVAWHDGPDAGARADFAALKEHEQRALAPRIPQPSVRGRSGVWAIPRIALEWRVPPCAPGLEYAALESWLGLGDVGLWAPSGTLTSALAHDPRVHDGDVPGEVARRAEFIVTVHTACLLADATALVRAMSQGPIVAAQVAGARSRHRALGVEPIAAPDGAIVAVPDDGPLDLEAFGRRWWA